MLVLGLTRFDPNETPAVEAALVSETTIWMLFSLASTFAFTADCSPRRLSASPRGSLRASHSARRRHKSAVGTQEARSRAGRGSAYLGSAEACAHYAEPPPMTPFRTSMVGVSLLLACLQNGGSQ